MTLSARTLSRLAGVLYLTVAVTGGFAQLYARSGVVVRGDAAATADNIRASASLFQLGIAADVVNIVAFAGVALLLFIVLSPVHRALSTAFATLAVMSATIIGLDLVNHAGALAAATDPYFGRVLGGDGADTLALLFLDLHRYGYLVAEVFFGLWLVPLGLVAYRSGYFPRLLGIGLMIGGVSYLGSFALSISAPGLHSDLSFLVALPAGVAELSFMAWLLLRGANVGSNHLTAAAAGSPAVSEGAMA
jgi:hypothetical protein